MQWWCWFISYISFDCITLHMLVSSYMVKSLKVLWYGFAHYSRFLLLSLATVNHKSSVFETYKRLSLSLWNLHSPYYKRLKGKKSDSSLLSPMKIVIHPWHYSATPLTWPTPTTMLATPTNRLQCVANTCVHVVPTAGLEETSVHQWHRDLCDTF